MEGRGTQLSGLNYNLRCWASNPREVGAREGLKQRSQVFDPDCNRLCLATGGTVWEGR